MMGFIDCMVDGDYTNLTLPNYSIVGFGFGGGNQLVPLIHLGFCAIPPLVLAHDALVISLSFGVFSSKNRGYGDGLQMEGEICFRVLLHIKSFALKLDHCHASNSCFRWLAVSAEVW